LARLGLGVALVAAGMTLVPRPAGLVIAALGLVPLAAGAFNLCPVAPLWGGHFFGAEYCATKKGEDERLTG
jgi:membrane-associated protease RseP (regulator of RpoE activity)